MLFTMPRVSTSRGPVLRLFVTTGVILLCAVTSPVAKQPQGPDPVYDAQGFKPSRDYYSPLPFEHIDTVSGNVVLSFTDLTLPGNAGFALSFVRSINLKGQLGPIEVGLPRPLLWGLDGLPLVVRRTAPQQVPDTSPTAYRMPTPQTADGANHPARWFLPNTFGTGDVLMTKETWRYTISTRRLELPNGLILAYDKVVSAVAGGFDGFLTSVTDSFNSTVVTLDWTGDRLVKVTQHLGNNQTREVTLGYASGAPTLPTLAHPTSMTYLGRPWTYELNGQNGTTSKVTPPVGPPWEYSGSSSTGNTFTVTTPQKGKVHYSFNTFKLLSGRKTERANSTFTFPNMLSSRSTEGPSIEPGTWAFTWTDNGPGLSNLTIAGPVRTVKYENAWLESGPTTWKRTVEVNQAALETETLTRSDYNMLYGTTIEEWDPVAVLDSRQLVREGKTYTTNYVYSEDNFKDFLRPRVITEIGDLTRTTTVAYKHDFTKYIRARVESAAVAVGTETYSRGATYNADTGFVESRTVHGIATTFTPTSEGNVEVMTDAKQHQTSFTYTWGVAKDVTTEEFGITREINPDGTVERETRRTLTTEFDYDDLGRPTLLMPPYGAGNATETSYENTEGAWVKVSRSASHFVKTYFDGFGRPIATEDGAGVWTRTEYDVEGRKTYQSYPHTGTSTGDQFFYDPLDRLTRITHSDQSYVDIQPYGGTITIIDEKAHGAGERVTVQQWEAFGDPSDARLASIEDANNKLWSYSHTALGALTRVNAPDDIPDREWSYNGKHQLASETHPESGTTSYFYDAVGNLEKKVDARNEEFHYTYDGNNRLTAISPTFQGTAEVLFGYDESDNRTRVSNGEVDSHFEFDAGNRLKRRLDTIAGTTPVTEYHYHGNDVLSAIDYPSGRHVDFALGDQTRITAVTSPGGVNYATSIQYHPSGAISQFTFGNGATESVAFDHPRQWPTATSSGPLSIQEYRYDNVGNVEEIVDARGGFGSTFGYDDLDRLTAVGGFGARTYTYDAAGNRLTKTVAPYTYTYAYSPATQRLDATDEAPMNGSFLYDAVGNTTTDAMGAYTYTRFNLMETATVNSLVASYGYDGDNMRVRKATPQDTRYYVHGVGGQLLAEYVQAGGALVLLREYVYLGSKLLSSWAPDETPPAHGRVTGVTAGPQSAPKNTVVTVTISGTSQPCSKVEVNFGDGTVTPYTIASPYLLPLVVTHTYTAAGLYTVVVTGQTGASGACTGTVSAPLEVTSGNVIANGDFSQVDANGFPIGWGQFTQGGAAYFNASTGVLNFYRTGAVTQAVILQYTGLAVPTGGPLEMAFKLGNTDTVRKRISVFVHTPAFDDLALCTFWLDAAQPLTSYTMRTHATKAWTDASASFYASDVNAAGSTAAYLLDDVTLTHRPANSSAKTDCVDPNRPTAGGESGGNLLQNPNFDTGTTSWSLTGQLASQVTNGTLEFHRIAGSPAPVIAQITGTTGAQDQRWAAVFELGNTSSTRQRVTVQLQNGSASPPSDFTNCVLWLAPNSAKQAYAITTYAAASWPTGAGITVTPATVAPSGSESAYRWLQFDTVSLSKTTQATLGTECFEPGSFEIEGGVPAPVPAPLLAAMESPLAPQTSAASNPSVTFHAGSEGGADDNAPLADGAAPPAVALTVGLGGLTSGTVTSSPAGISCGGQGLVCTGWFPEGTSVTLTATADVGQTFAGWSGECAGTGSSCVVSMVGAQAVSAVFTGPAVRTFYHLDALGSVRAVTSGMAPYTVIKRHDYFAFGEDTAGMTGDPRRFTGKEIDAETAMQYFGARYFRNTVGRFTSVDPTILSAVSTNPQTWNRFAYALNNPLKYVDPDGQLWVKAESATNPYRWVDACPKNTACFESIAVAMSGGTRVYGSSGADDITDYAKNASGVVNVADLAGHHDAKFEVARNQPYPEEYLAPGQAAALFNVARDYRAAYSGDAMIVFTGGSTANGGPAFDSSGSPLHAAHKGGTNIDLRYMGSDGRSLVGSSAAARADVGRTQTLIRLFGATGLGSALTGAPARFGLGPLPASIQNQHGTHIHFQRGK